MIDGCLDLFSKKELPEKIEVRLHPLAIERTDRPNPKNAIEARLSAQHAVAVAFLRGKAGVAEFGDAAATDPQIVAMRKRVHVMPDESLDKMAAGIGEVHIPAARRLDDARLEAKFREQAGSQAEAWKQFVDGLVSSAHVRLPD